MMRSEGAATAAFSPELVDVGPEGAASAVAQAGQRATELVEAWVKAKNAAAVAALAEDDRAPGPARKAARRGLSVLKSRGVSIPDRAHVARMGGDVMEGYEAWFVAPDAAATSAVILCRRWKSGRNEVARVTFRDGFGLLQIDALQLSRTHLKGLLAETTQAFRFEPVPVSVDWARFRIAAARAAHATSGAIVPLGFDTHADLVGPAPAAAPVHPIDEAKLELREAESVVPRSYELHVEPEFAGWLPSGAAVQALLLDVGQRLGAAKETEGGKLDAALRGALDEVTDHFFTVEAREQIASLMKDAAVSVLARRGRDAAADVMVVATAVRSAGLITHPPHEVPFLRAFFQKALAYIAAKNNGQLPIPVAQGAAGEPSGLMGTGEPSESPIITPAEAAAEKAAPGEKISPGGIILP